MRVGTVGAHPHLPVMHSGRQLRNNAVGPLLNGLPIAEVALDHTGETGHRALTQRQQGRLVAAGKGPQIATVDVGQQRAHARWILRRMLRNSVHADRKCPHRLALQVITETLHEVVGLRHPLENVHCRADDHGIVGGDRSDLGGGDAIDRHARFLKPLGDGVGDIIRRPVLGCCSNKDVHALMVVRRPAETSHATPQ